MGADYGSAAEGFYCGHAANNGMTLGHFADIWRRYDSHCRW